MTNYSILSYNFNDYDILRDPICNYTQEMIYVTDSNYISKKWTVVIENRLKIEDPIYASYYVRYHPFEFTNSDVVVIIDSSIQLNDNITPIVDEFIKSGADMTIMCSSYRNDEDKLRYWNERLGRFSKADVDKYVEFINNMGQSNELGAIGLAFQIIRNNARTKKFLEDCWRLMLDFGGGIPARLDEIIVHKLLKKYLESDEFTPYIVSNQIIQSSYMTYMVHKSSVPIKEHKNYDQMYYLCNKPVYPHRFDKLINFPETFKYKTEAMLLTKYLNPDDLDEWLDWHINKCKFDRIHIFDNESDYDMKPVLEKYGDRVTYELVEGRPRQYQLYDCYVNYRSNAEWIMPIDDDEYLDIGDFDSIYDGVMYYRNKFPHMDMLAVRWKHLFPKDLYQERTGNVLDYCTEVDHDMAKKFITLGDGAVKTIIRRYGQIHYEETWENPAGGHVPKNSVFLGALLSNGVNVRGCGISEYANVDTLDDERIRILHCRYKGPEDWNRKYGKAGSVRVSDAVDKTKEFEFSKLINK